MKMKRTLPMVLLITLTLSACTPARPQRLTPAATAALVLSATHAPTTASSNAPTPTLTTTPMPTPTSTPSPMPTPSPTPRPHAKVTELTFLFDVPDDLSKRKPLTTGTEVYLIARYKDFAQVEVPSFHRKGFVPVVALSNLPASLPSLEKTAIPWVDATDDLRAHLGISPDAFANGEGLVFDNLHHDYYNDYVPYILKPVSAFRLTFRISTTGRQFGSVKLTDKPNRSDTEWWKGIHRIDFVTRDGNLEVDIRDGRTEHSMVTIQLGVPDTQAITVTFLDPKGKEFVVTDSSGHKIRTVDVRKVGLDLTEGLFPEGIVYIGRVVSPHSKLSIENLSLLTISRGRFSKKQPGLRELADRCGISLGTNLESWRMQYPGYYNAIFDNCDTLVLSGFSWKGFWRGRGDYDFEPLDSTVNWAIQNGFRIRASHLVWGATEASSQVIPDWLKKGKFSREEYIQILKEHVLTVVGHFKGRVKEWSIANEAISRSAYSGSDFWMDKIGPEYIEMSFRWAHEADPNAILIFNDFNNESPRDRETKRVIKGMYRTVKDLKARGVPIDVVGMQMHLLLKYSSPIPPTKKDVVETMRKFGSLGVKIYVTEFDVDLHNVHGTRQERWLYEARLYREMMKACVESGVCTSFSTWGVSDSDSWLTCQKPWCVNEPDADPLMFDRNFKPKPAYVAVRDVLSECVGQPKAP